MKKTINLKIDKESLIITLNTKTILTLTTVSNSINIKKLYGDLNPQKEDLFELGKKCKKIEKTKAYIDNLFNNTLLFFEELILELSKICIEKKIKE